MENLYKRRHQGDKKSVSEDREGSEGVQENKKGDAGKKSSPKHILGEQVLKIATRESAHNSFGKALLEEAFVDYKIHHQSKFIDYTIAVPPSLCFDSSSSAAPHNICVSAMLALFDELSTMALFVFDKTRRPGVSVELTTEILRPIHEGEVLHVHTIIEKTGKFLAFCTLEVYNQAGVLVARGSHVKFLPMGWVWDLLAGGWLLPLAIFFYQLFRGNKIKTPLDKFFRAKEAGETISAPFHPVGNDVFAVYKSLGVTAYVPDSDSDKQLLECKDVRRGIFQVKVRRDLMNPVKSMHGGAVACSIEDACRQFLQYQHPSEANKLMISELSIQYQSPLKVRVEKCFCFLSSNLCVLGG